MKSSISIIMDRGLHVIYILLIFTMMHISLAAPIVSMDTEAVNFLEKYGFLKPQNKAAANIIDHKEYRSALMKLQNFYGYPQTGSVDEHTKRLITGSRCGLPDMAEETPLSRGKRYVLHGSYWPNPNLRYFIKKYTDDLPTDLVDKGIESALRKWSSVSGLTFRQVYQENSADFHVMWATGEHGDGTPFDGSGGALAHAFYPSAGGNVHMDDDETWSIDIDNSKHNFIHVFTHEVGHSLGLRHSSDHNSMMYAYINRYDVKMNLSEDDVAGIQEIYGASNKETEEEEQTVQPAATQPTATPTAVASTEPRPRVTRPSTINPFLTTPTAPNQEVMKEVVQTTIPSRLTTKKLQIQTQNPVLVSSHALPSYCHQVKQFDAIFKLQEHVYIFWGSQYFRWTSGLAVDNPREISQDWYPLPDNIDAALYWPRKGENIPKILFFKGEKIWIFDENKEFLYETTISSFFSGKLPNNIDAAFSNGNSIKAGNTYFTKGGEYYMTTIQDVTSLSGPYPTADWGLPDGVDAAFSYDSIGTFFFVGDHFFSANTDPDDMKITNSYHPGFSATLWLSC